MDWIADTISHLAKNEVILMPTDTIWGLGANALDTSCSDRIYQIKKRPATKSFILLMKDYEQLSHYVDDNIEEIIPILEAQNHPTTVIYSQPNENLPKHLLADDGSVAIRIPTVDWLISIISGVDFPLISTSANQSGQANPTFRNQIEEQIVKEVDFVSKPPEELVLGKPSQILRLTKEQGVEWIRR